MAVEVFLSCLLVAMVTGVPVTDQKEVELRMPGVQPKVVSTINYMCVVGLLCGYC